MSAQAPHVEITGREEIPAAIDGAGLRRGRPVVVLVGGAAGMDEGDLETVAEVFRKVVVPIVESRDAVVVDGGTDSGVMRLIGRARAESGGRFALVGVAVARTVVVPGGGAPNPDAAELEPNHTLFLLVPGTDWGDEAQWIADVADVIAGGRPSVTLLVNGGKIAYEDVRASHGSNRSVVVLAGSGRTADAIVGARAGQAGEPDAVTAAESPLTLIADMGEAGAVAEAIETALDGRRADPGDPAPGL